MKRSKKQKMTLQEYYHQLSTQYKSYFTPEEFLILDIVDAIVRLHKTKPPVRRWSNGRTALEQKEIKALADILDAFLHWFVTEKVQKYDVLLKLAQKCYDPKDTITLLGLIRDVMETTKYNSLMSFYRLIKVYGYEFEEVEQALLDNKEVVPC